MRPTIDPELSLDADWSITERAFERIVELFEQCQPRSIVEFGSGSSSVRLALAFPRAKVISVEHDDHYFARTRSLQERHLSFRNNLTVLRQSLAWQFHGPVPYRCYQKPQFPETVDCVLVDGPPCSRGREACLYQTYDRIPASGIVVLDDYDREEEQQIVRNWLETYPGSFDLQRIETGHHLVVLTKVRAVRPRLLPRQRIADNYSVLVRGARLRAKQMMSSFL